MTTNQGPYAAQYPVQFAVEYPDRPLNRLTSFFRIFVIIPIAVVLGAVSGATWESAGSTSTLHHSTTYYGPAGAGGLLFFGPLLMILFRQKYPRWWFDWNLELQRFINRVWTYLALMNDSYPSTDDHQWVQLDYAYPDAATDLNRWLPLVKWLLAIPHYIVLFFLEIAAFFAVIVTWFAILFTGRYPRWHIQLRRRRIPLAQPGRRIRVRPGHRSVPAIHAGAVTRHRKGARLGCTASWTIAAEEDGQRVRISMPHCQLISGEVRALLGAPARVPQAGRGAGSDGRISPAGGSTREEWRTNLPSVIQQNWVDVRTSQCCPELSSQESDGVTAWPSRADGCAEHDADRPAGSEIRRSCTCQADRDGICAGG